MMSIGLGELSVIAVILAMPVLGIVGIVLLVKGTKEKTNLGINFTIPSACPKCGAPLPGVRVPKNFRQMMFGGWTCSGCGVELDKWGRPLQK